MPKENTLIAHIRVYVKTIGGKVVKITQNGFSEAGIPDLLIFEPTMTYMVETKAPGKKPTTIQLAKIAEINKAGGKAFWTDSFKDFCKKRDRL